MSKDKKMVKEKKKPASPIGKKSQSDYQAGKSSVSNLEISAGKKK